MAGVAGRLGICVYGGLGGEKRDSLLNTIMQRKASHIRIYVGTRVLAYLSNYAKKNAASIFSQILCIGKERDECGESDFSSFFFLLEVL